MKEVICKIDVVGLTGGQFYKHEIYEVNHEFENGIYLIDGEIVQSKYFDDMRVGVVVHKGVNGKAVKGLELGKEYPVIGVLGGPLELKGYYICCNDNEDVRCVSSEVFDLPEWLVEADADNPFLGFTTDELIAEIERRNEINTRVKKLIEIYGISSEYELDEIKQVVRILLECSCVDIDVETLDFTEGIGKCWGLTAMKFMEKAVDTGLDYETLVKKLLLGLNVKDMELYWTDEE